MLSRSAEGLYWMGRYLERAEHLCRLLRVQVEMLVDRPVREILFGWSRIYASLDRPPPAGDLAPEANDDYTLADSYTLAGDLTFERSNPASVWNSLAMARENARQMRHCISAGMWSCLNLAYLRVRGLDIPDIWRIGPEDFYAGTARDIHTFMGVAEATMYRDEGWRFMRLGRSIECAQLCIALLLAQIATARPQDGETSDADWTSLLRVCQAFDAYERSYSVEIHPERVLDLLATDPLLPGSLCRSLDAAAEELAAIGPAPDARAGAAAERLAGRLRALIRHDWPDRDDREAVLAQAGGHCGELHDRVIAAWIDYDVEDSPALRRP